MTAYLRSRRRKSHRDDLSPHAAIVAEVLWERDDWLDGGTDLAVNRGGR